MFLPRLLREGVEKDREKAIYHAQLAAIGGHEISRHNLGVAEGKLGNYHRAYKHCIIAAKSGMDESLKKVGDGYKAGYVTKDEYATTLRAYQQTRDAMKSEQRARAAATDYMQEMNQQDDNLTAKFLR